MIAATPFDFPYDGRLAPARTALMVIDLQNDFLGLDGYYARHGYDVTPLRAVLPNVNRLLRAARRAGALVVQTRQGYRADLADMTNYERWRRARAGLEATRVLIRGEPGFEIDAGVDVAATDVIVDKTANGAFTGTDLDHVLRVRGISHLIFTGCTTDVCVQGTLREACDRNYQCLTVSDACASGDARAHEAALYMIGVEDGIFGAVATTEAVLAGLARAGGS